MRLVYLDDVCRYLIQHVSFLLQKTSVGKRVVRGPRVIRVVSSFYSPICGFSKN